MQSFKNFLSDCFAVYDRAQHELSLRWRENANRRTIFVLLCAGALMGYAYIFFLRPPEDFPLNELVTIPAGATLNDTGKILEDDGVVRSGKVLKVIVTLLGHEGDVHAGDYIFKEPQNLLSIARTISIGAYGLEPMHIRVPEGATVGEMAVLFGSRLQRFNEEGFLTKARPLEGFLFPDTYFFLPNATEDLVLHTMLQNFDSHEQSIDAEIQAFGRPLKDDVIMASILEREAHTMQDRRMIAGVLWNRLDKGMLLQVDAAFFYILGKGTFQLTTADLGTDSPYNTYRYKGLPPGAIGNPSLDSLLAAVTPEKHQYLYYLADKNGVTHFSKTYAEHLRKKSLYVN